MPVVPDNVPMYAYSPDQPIPVRALSAKGKLTKGSDYYVSHITCKGQVSLVGYLGQLFQMEDFVQLRPTKEPANDNTPKK